MLTQCPNCETTFRVTSEILRVAQGQVRCGRCQTQFDALQRLIEERPPATAAMPTRAQRAVAPAAAVDADEPSDIEVEEEREILEEITMEGKRIEISGTYRVLDDTTASGSHLRQEVVEEWMEMDEDVLAGVGAVPEGYIDVSDEAAADDDPEEAAEESGQFNTGDFDELEAFRKRLSRELPATDNDVGGNDDAPVDEPIDEPVAEPVAESRNGVRAWRRSTAEALEVDDPDDEDNEDLSLPGGRQRREPVALAWKILFVPLLLVLGMQVVHHNRAELARDPRVGAPLVKIYQALNLDLTPDWDLRAYEIRQWGVITDASAPGTLKVRASLINRATFPQPYPLLKLVLEDRWGDQVRAREFEPADYLDPGVAADRLFAPETQANATIVIVDPGPDAEGFRFDVCLRGAAGPVCAEDIPPEPKR